MTKYQFLARALEQVEGEIKRRHPGTVDAIDKAYDFIGRAKSIARTARKAAYDQDSIDTNPAIVEAVEAATADLLVLTAGEGAQLSAAAEEAGKSPEAAAAYFAENFEGVLSGEDRAVAMAKARELRQVLRAAISLKPDGDIAEEIGKSLEKSSEQIEAISKSVTKTKAQLWPSDFCRKPRR
jgi:hypothetical protein